MHILILGGRGFIGSRLQRLFQTSSVCHVDVLNSDQCDLTNKSSVDILRAHIFPETHVIFCSTISRLRDASISAYGKNMAMATNVAMALDGQAYSKLVFLSSIDVYGRPPVENLISKSTHVDPSSYYGLAKQASEQLLSFGHHNFNKLGIIRLPGIFSLDNNDDSALGQIYRRLKQNQTVNLSGGGTHLRTYLHIENLFRVILEICQGDWTGLINVSSVETYSVRDFTEKMKRSLNSTSSIVDSPENGSEFDISIDHSEILNELPELKLLSLNEILCCAKGA